MNTLSIQTSQTTQTLTAEHVQRFAFAYCWKRIGNEDDAKEFSQYFVLQFLQRKNREHKMTATWHILNVRNLFRNFLNRHKDNRQIPVPEPRHIQSNQSNSIHSFPTSPKPDPLESAQLEELLEIIDSIRSRFNRRDRQIIQMKIQGYSSTEISAVIAQHYKPVSISNIDVIYHRFKTTLKKSLVSKGFHLSKGDCS